MRSILSSPFRVFCAAMMVTLTLQNVASAIEISAGTLRWDGTGEAVIPITLANGSDTAPAALSFNVQWDSAPITLVSVDAGAASTAASKDVMSNGNLTGVRVLVGAVNETFLEDGVIAELRISGPGTPANTARHDITLEELSAAAFDATRVPVTTSAGQIILLGADATPPNLTVDTNAATVGFTNPSATVNVGNSGDSILSWSASSDTASIMIEPDSGTDETAVTITATEFSTAGTATVTFVNDANASDSETITVTIDELPDPADLDVSTNQLTLTDSAVSGTFNVLNLGDLPLSWTAESDTPSVTVAPLSGTDATEITVTATVFTQDLTANITVTNSIDALDTETIVVSVERTPLPSSLGVSSNTMTLTDTSASGTFNIINEGDLPLRWTVLSNNGSVTVEPASGTGETEVTVTGSDFSVDRTVNLTVSNFDDASDTETIVVQVSGPQEPGDLEVSTNTLTLAEAANTGTFNILNGGELPLNWTVTSDTASVGVSAESGTGEAEILVTASDFTADLTATLTVTNTDDTSDTETIVVQVTGTAAPSNLGVSTSTITLTVNAPTATFNILNNGEAALNWSAASNNTAVSVTPDSGTGEATVTVGAADFSTELTVNITITNDDDGTDTETIVVTISTAGKTGSGCAPGAPMSPAGHLGDFVLLAALSTLLFGGRKIGAIVRK